MLIILGFSDVKLKYIERLHFWEKTGPLTIGNDENSIYIALFKGEPNNNCSVIAFNVTGEEFINWNKRIKNELSEIIKVNDHSVAFFIYFEDP